MGELLVPN